MNEGRVFDTGSTFLPLAQETFNVGENGKRIGYSNNIKTF